MQGKEGIFRGGVLLSLRGHDEVGKCLDRRGDEKVDICDVKSRIITIATSCKRVVYSTQHLMKWREDDTYSSRSWHSAECHIQVT